MEQNTQRFGNPRLVQLPGKSTFADEYLGEHMYLNTPASVKVLRAKIDPPDKADFLNEADQDDLVLRLQAVPLPLTPLIGRESELLAVQNLFQNPGVRLVTLTGTGGVGKSHLAMTLGNILQETFDDGVVFISLASVFDSELVVPAIMQALGLNETGEHSPLQLLKTFLRHKRLLLVLDNFEQILPAAPHLSELLLSCSQLKILVTSRVVLHVWGEHVFRVLPLEIPDVQQLSELESLAHIASVALFVQRAEAILPEFELTTENARDIAGICKRLDGLPLALELAATQCNLLPPNVIATRLKHPIDMLARGRRDAPLRHQTLRNMLSWNDDLLTPDELKLFRRLAVYEQSFTLQMAEEVMSTFGDISISVLDGITSLIDKSILQQTVFSQEDHRLYFLEVLRAYGLELLSASGETGQARDAYALYFMARAEVSDIDSNQGAGQKQSQGNLHLLDLHFEKKPLNKRHRETQEVVINLSSVGNTTSHRRNHLEAPAGFLSTPPLEELTAREVEVLQLLAQGLSNKQIAKQLILSPHTVSGHIQSIFGKLALNTRSAATRYALEHHLA